jgi:dCTP deaminase
MLGREEIKDLIRNGNLIITPILDIRQIGNVSVDIRLGCSIMILKKAYISHIDVTNEREANNIEKIAFDEVTIQPHREFVLHSKAFILASTFEYICLPNNISCYVLSRSSPARIGLKVELASLVKPETKACLTLELSNTGEIPIVLYPGLLVAQLVFYRTERSGDYEGRYDCPTRAEAPKFWKSDRDREMRFWRKRPE